MRKLQISLSDLLLFLLLLAGPVFGGLVRAVPRAAAHLSIVLLAAFPLLIGIYRGSFNLRRSPLDLPFVLFILIAFLSVSRAMYPYAARTELFRLVACIALLYFVSNSQRGTIKLFRLCQVLVIAGGIHAGLGLLLAAHKQAGISLFFANHSHFAGHLEMLVWLAVGLAIVSHEEKRLIFFSLAILMAAAVALSLSRGGMISLAAGCGFYFAVLIGINKDMPGSLRLLLIFLLLLFATLVQLGMEPILARLHTLADPLTADQGRLEIWQGTLDMIAQRSLLGYGLGSFPFAFPAFQPDSLSPWFVNHAHNDYLELAAETGLLGLAAALLAVSVLFIACLRKLRMAERRHFQPVGAGALAGCFSLLVHSTTDFNFHIPANAILFAVLAGIALVAAEGACGWEEASAHISFNRSGKLAGITAVFLVACLTGAAALSPYLGRKYEDKADEYQQKGNYEAAAVALEQAMRYDLGNAELMESMGDLLMVQAWSGEQRTRRFHLRKALDWQEKAAAACPVCGEFMSRKAYLLGQLGRHGDEEQALRAALRLQPADSFSNYRLASLCLRKGRLDEAFGHFRRFLVLSNPSRLSMVLDELLAAGAALRSLGRAVPATAAFRLTFAEYLAGKDETGLALRQLKLAFALEPNEDNALAYLRLFRRSTDAATALAETGKYLNRFPDSLRLREEQAILLEQLGRKAEAMFIYRNLQQSERQAGHAAAVRWCLSLARLHAADQFEAIAVLRQGIKKYPGEAGLHYALGLHLRSLEMRDEALSSLKEAVQLAPENTTYRHQLGAEYQQAGLDSNAFMEWAACLEMQPDFGPCQAAMAKMEEQSGLPRELLRYELGPLAEFENQEKETAYFLHIAAKYDELDRPEKAAAVLRWGIGKYPHEARLHYALGMLLRQTGESKQALAALRQAVFLEYDKAEYRHQLGEEYWRTGLRQQAAAEWRICLEIQPDFVECKEGLERVE